MARDPLEKAFRLREHLERRGCTQTELAARLGMPRPTLTNLLALLELPLEVQEMLWHSEITATHATLLVTLGDAPKQRAFAGMVLVHGWSVRRLQRAIQAHLKEIA